MSGERLEFELVNGGTVLTFPRRLVVAGYTGRDGTALQQHIDELAEQGIAPPATVPMFYELAPELVTLNARPAVVGSRTSGEVEPVYVRASGHWYLGVGSDHTDRDLEREDIARAKGSCVKPVGTKLIRLPDDLLAGGYDQEFDSIAVASWVDDTSYQQGNLNTLRPPGEVLSRLFDTLGPDEESDLVVFGGTVPLRSEIFTFGTTWRLKLDTRDGGSLEHTYTVTPYHSR